MKHAVACIAALLCASASAQVWLPIGDSSDGVMAIDFRSIRPQGQYTKAWVRFLYKQPQTTVGYPAITYQSVVALSYFDCKSGTYAEKQGNFYADATGLGKIVSSYSRTEAQLNFEDPIPGTLGRNLLDYACIKR